MGGGGPLHTAEGAWVGDHLAQECKRLHVPELQGSVFVLHHQVVSGRECNHIA